jgi:parvulin-like peptidyl-prolyl isomerase
MKFTVTLLSVSVIFVLAACSPSDPKNPKFVVAQVNKTKVTRAELDVEIAKMVKRIGMDPTQLNEDQAESLQWYALNEIVDRKVVQNALTKEQSADVTKQVDERIAGIKRQFESEEAYREALLGEGLSEQEIRDDAAHQASLQKLAPQEGTPASLEDAKAFYEGNPELWKVQEQVRARHVLVRTEATSSIEQTNARKKEAEAARTRISKGEDFSKVASEVSEDPGSKTRGGELPPFGRGQMVPEFEKAAFETGKGKLSPVFKTDYGFHFLEVLDKQGARTVPFEEVAPRILQAVTQQKQQESARKVLADLKAKAGVVLNIKEPNTGNIQLKKE